METAQYTDLAGATFFTDADVGFVRLRISLDANHDGVAEATSMSPAFAFRPPRPARLAEHALHAGAAA